MRKWSGCFPMEPAAVGDEDFLFPQQIERKAFVAHEMEAVDVQFREDVKRRFRFDGAHARNVV